MIDTQEFVLPRENDPVAQTTVPTSSLELQVFDGQAARILQTFVHSSKSHIGFVKRDLTWSYLNAAAVRALGKAPDELIGQKISDSIVNDHPRPLAQMVQSVFASGEAIECDTLVKNHAHVEQRWMRIAVTPYRDETNDIVGALVRARDVNGEMVARATADAHGDLIQRYLDVGQLAFIQMTPMLRVQRWSNAAAQHFGWSSEQAVGRKFNAVCKIHPDDLAHVKAALRRACREFGNQRLHVRCRNITRDGESLWCDWYASVVSEPESGKRSVMCFAMNVTESVEAKEALNRAARFDPLTLLPNRYAFYEALSTKLANAHTQGYVLFVDLDGFKEVNDRYGHKTGDELLQRVAARLTRVAGDDAICARYGGDEFALFLAQSNDAPSIGVIAEKLISELHRPFEVGALNIEISCSVGVAATQPDTRDAQALITHADLAMYQAKANGRDQFALYSPALGERERTRLQLHTGLRDALRNGHIQVHYQPRVDASTLRIVGAEALARWQNPDGSFISPSDFISVAEETGLIHDLGARVLQQACEFARKVNGSRNAVGGPFVISVNLSTVQLRQPQFVKRAKAIFTSVGCLPHWIEFEVTESRELTDTVCVERLNDLVKRFGARCALDDFGTGYSNIVELTNLPLSVMKIDRSIVSKLSPTNTSLVAAVLAMANSLSLEAVAEGVETQAQLEQLRALGCKSFQGFLFSPAMPADALVEKLSLLGITHT